MKTVYLNASYFPAVELLSAIGTAVILLYGGYQALDLATESARNAQIGDRRRVRRLPRHLLRPDPAALQPLHDLPAGDGGAGQDLRPARHRAGPGRQAGRDRSRDAARRDRAGPRLVLVRARQDSRPEAIEREDRDGPRGRARTTTTLGDGGRVGPHPRRRDAGAGRRDRRREVHLREAGLALLRPAARAGARRRPRSARPEAQCLRSQLGIVPQEGFLFSGTVRENIAFGRPDASDEEIEAAADAIGAGEFIRRMPNGFDTEVGERGVALSAGPAAADRVRAGAAGRAADPDPRRGDLERGRADRADDRAGPRAAAGGPDRDRDRAPPLDDPQRRTESRCWRTAASWRAARTTS